MLNNIYVQFRRSPWQPCGGRSGRVEAGSGECSQEVSAAVQVGGTGPDLKRQQWGYKERESKQMLKREKSGREVMKSGF